MATLFNTKISATYEGLLKTIDNAAISATLKELTDGSGNQSGLFLNTSGDFKVTSVLEWGSLKDTGTGVTITRFVTAANGIENFNNDTSLPTSAAVKLYVDTKFAITDTLTEVLGFGNTTSGKDIAVSAGDDITFTSTSKAIFGTGGEFGIYQSASGSRIITSSKLYIQTTEFRLQKVGGEQMIEAYSDGAVKLYFNNADKLETSATGISVTGRISGITNPTLAQDAATKSYVDTKFSGGYTLTEVLGFGNTTSGKDIALSAGDDVTFSDTSKILIGAGNDLQIYKDGSNGKILHSGIGLLEIASNGVVIRNAANNENMITAVQNGEVTLYFDNSKKIETTTTGFTVTGRISGMQDPTLSQDAATKSYVDNIVTIQDLDFYANTGSGQVDLDTQSFIIEGDNGIETTASSNALIIDGSVLSTGIATNATNIATNVTNIATNSTVTGNNATNITANFNAIASNNTDIAANQSSILANTANIGQNSFLISVTNANLANTNASVAANTAAIAAHPIIINGMVNNLGSQGSGGYDFMEWTSNITGSTQIPLWRNPQALKVAKITFVWMGDTALQIGAGEQVAFTIGNITNNTSARIANYNVIDTLFTLDSSFNNTFASGEVTFATPIPLAAFQNLAIVGTETGTVTPNNGELGISLLLLTV